jgi:hypothetical protein
MYFWHRGKGFHKCRKNTAEQDGGKSSKATSHKYKKKYTKDTH